MIDQTGKRLHFHDRYRDWDDAWLFPRFIPPTMEKKLLSAMFEGTEHRSAMEEMITLGWRPSSGQFSRP